MKTVFTPVDSRQDVILNPIYMTRDQWECAYYIPIEDRSRIIIVDFMFTINASRFWHRLWIWSRTTIKCQLV